MGWYTWWAYILIECFGIKCPDRRTEYGGGRMNMVFTSQWTCSGWLLNALVQPIYNCDILETIDQLIKYPVLVNVRRVLFCYYGIGKIRIDWKSNQRRLLFMKPIAETESNKMKGNIIKMTRLTRARHLP